jgi:hypothetical protein
LIDTDVAAIREWAQSVCDTYASQAQPVEPP